MDDEPNRVERAVERVLWWSRLVVLVPVAFSILVAFALIIIATVDAIYILAHLSAYTGNQAQAPTLLIGKVIKVADMYLLAAFLIVFAFGLYELFVSQLRIGNGGERAPRFLIINSLDELKTRLGQVALLVLIVEFMQVALGLDYPRPLDLLFLAAGIALVAGALVLSGRAGHGDDS